MRQPVTGTAMYAPEVRTGRISSENRLNVKKRRTFSCTRDEGVWGEWRCSFTHSELRYDGDEFSVSGSGCFIPRKLTRIFF